MRAVVAALMLVLLAWPADAQTKKPPAKRPAPARKSAPRPTAPAPITRVPASIVCPSELGLGIATKRRFCDVTTAPDPRAGVVVTVPPHQDIATLSFELHVRHTHSADQVRAKTAYRHYTATIGVLTMDNTLVTRAIIEHEVRTERDLFDRVGAGPALPVKAVAPAGAEFVQVPLPEGVTEVAILGEKLAVVRPDGSDLFTSLGRPIASISNVMIEYRPAPPLRTPVKKNR